MSERKTPIDEQIFELLFGDLKSNEQAALRAKLSAAGQDVDSQQGDPSLQGGSIGLDSEGNPIPSLVLLTPEIHNTFDSDKHTQSLNCEWMAAHFGGSVWDWVNFDEFRYMVASNSTQGAYNGGFWTRYNLEVNCSNGAKYVPILYTELSKPITVYSQNYYSAELDQYGFAVFVTVIALTVMAESAYQRDKDNSMVYYALRDAVILAMRNGLCLNLDQRQVDALEQLFD
ncbi:TPA: hypothetical protein NGR52_004264 [Vibrio parahaemolyticus]|nr:hypothetical protein [Vibrio parahaemolyticus]